MRNQLPFVAVTLSMLWFLSSSNLQIVLLNNNTEHIGDICRLLRMTFLVRVPMGKAEFQALR